MFGALADQLKGRNTMPRYTDIGRVPGAWRDASIASTASSAIRSHGYYDPGRHAPLPSNASGHVDTYVSSRTSSEYNSLRSAGDHISRGLANGTATRAEVNAYNSRVRDFASRNPAPPSSRRG